MPAKRKTAPLGGQTARRVKAEAAASATPVFTSATYTPGTLRAAWACTPPAGFTGYTVMLVIDGGAPITFPTTAASLTTARTLPPTSTCTLQVAMNVSGQQPVLSAVITLITQAPALQSVTNSGSKVVYRWTKAGGAGVGAYFVGLFTPATNYNISTGPTVFTATFQQALSGVGTCTGFVRAASADGVVLGPPSDVRTLITEAPGLVSLVNRGTAVDYRWTAAAGGGVEAYIATLSTPATNFNNSTGPQTFKTSFAALASGVGTCTGWVRASSADGVVLGPPTAVRTLITEAPALSLIDNTAVKVIYAWGAAGGTGVEAYIATLSTPFSNYNQSAPPSVLTATFDQALAGLGACTGWVRAASADGVVLGPPAKPRPLITEAPAVSLIADNGAEVVYTWAAAGGGGVEAYVATLATPATNYNSSTDASVLTTTFNQTLVGVGVCTGWVRATSADRVVLGPAATPLGLITQPPTLSALAYDIGQLGVTWTPTSAGSTGYVASVSQSGQPTRDFPIGTSGTGTAQVTLTLSGAYQVVVRGNAPQVLGPPSNPLQPLTTRPAPPAVTATTPSGFKVAWSPDTDPRVTGYLADLLVNGVSQGAKAETASPAPFSGTIATGVVYQGRVRATAPQLMGPWTDLVNGPYQSSEIPTYDPLGRLTALAWDARETVTYALDAFGNIQSVTWRNH